MTLPLAFGSLTIGEVTFNLYFMLVGLAFAVIGLQSIYFGCLAHVFLDYGGRARQRWRRIFQYNKAVGASAAIFTLGFGLDVALAVNYVSNHFTLPGPSASVDHLGIVGLLFMIIGFSTFCFTLLLHATEVRYGRHDD
jgi:hypothetical protein